MSATKINEGLVSIYAIGLRSSYLPKFVNVKSLNDRGEGERVVSLLLWTEAWWVAEDTVYCSTKISDPVIKTERRTR